MCNARFVNTVTRRSPLIFLLFCPFSLGGTAFLPLGIVMIWPTLLLCEWSPIWGQMYIVWREQFTLVSVYTQKDIERFFYHGHSTQPGIWGLAAKKSWPFWRPAVQPFITHMALNDPVGNLLKTLLEKEKILVASTFFFSHCFLPDERLLKCFWVTFNLSSGNVFNLSSANVFHLAKAKILASGKRLDLILLPDNPEKKNNPEKEVLNRDGT